MNYTLHNGDCLDILRTMPDNSIDAVVTDPPYGLSFMGKKWDYDVPSIEIWQECLRVLKPGGHLLAFAGTRTQHRMAVRIEDAGFEIRDMIAWVYGSGFPKSLDVSKAIDKAAGAEREIVGVHPDAAKRTSGTVTASGWETPSRCNDITAPSTPAAKQWQGWGTALKPALEPITVARKPLKGTVAANVLEHGTGAINVDGCRVGTEAKEPNIRKQKSKPGVSINNQVYSDGWVGTGNSWDGTLGRWPANLIHDGSEEVVGMFPEVKAGVAINRNRDGVPYRGNAFGTYGRPPAPDMGYSDSGSAARFFYCAKASKADRGDTNNHPTVKPTDLMRYLCRLVTPPGGIVLDPFTGSGSTGKAAILEGFQFIGIEREAEYVEIARARIEHAINSKPNTLF
jgi:site-specific DNA-methyltransferase (adenine-specific)